MNERIKELALDSGAVVTGIVATNYGKDINPVCKVDIQKFAELIVEECAELMETQHTWITSVAASTLIRNHFKNEKF